MSIPDEFTVKAAIAALDVASPDLAATSARVIKNDIIGNPTNKRMYLENAVVPRLVTCAAQTQTHPILAEHAVAALGSLAAYLPPSETEKVTNVLLQCLFSESQRPVFAAARALKLLVCAPPVDQLSLTTLIVSPSVTARLVSLLSVRDEGVAEVCAVIIGHTAENVNSVQVYDDAGAVQAVVSLLGRTLHERCIEACVNALVALARHSIDVSYSLTTRHGIISTLMSLMRTPLHSLRLAVCRLLTLFHLAGQLPVGLDANVTLALVNLLTCNSASTLDYTCRTLAELVLRSPSLQRVATESGAIVKLADILVPADDRNGGKEGYISTGNLKRDVSMGEVSESFFDEDGEDVVLTMCVSALRAIAALTDDYDAARETVVAKNLLPSIIKGLSDDSCSVVEASVQCIRSMSRSVKILRNDMKNKEIGEKVLSLLHSEKLEVKRSASAALCNLVPEFSPVREAIIQSGGIDIVIDLLQWRDQEVRKNALWALKNLLYKADLEMKSLVLSKLGCDSLRGLFIDREPRIRALAMTVMRNLACSSSADEQIKQLDALFAATGEHLITMLCSALKADSTNIEMAVQALYVVCNIASGTEQHKAFLLESEIPQLILQWTSHADEQARIAAVWCAINLSWKEPAVSPRRQTRAIRRAIREGRSSSSASGLDLLRHQHLPLPASPADRRILQRYGVNSMSRFGSGSSDGNDDTWFEENTLDEQTNTEGDQSESNSDGSGDRRSRLDGTQNELVRTDEESEMSPSGYEASGSGEVEGSAGDNSGSNSSCSKSCGYEWRIERLRQLGFEGRLRSLVNDPHIEVQGRARRALEHFGCGDLRPLDYDPSALLDPNSTLAARSRIPPDIARNNSASRLYISSS